MMELLCRLLFVLFFIHYATAASKPKPITTTLDTKWTRHSIAMEASEFLAEKNDMAFWGFVEQMAAYPDELGK